MTHHRKLSALFGLLLAAIALACSSQTDEVPAPAAEETAPLKSATIVYFAIPG